MLPEKLSVYFNLCNIINGRQPHLINTLGATKLHDHISRVETDVYFYHRRDILVPKQKIYKGGKPPEEVIITEAPPKKIIRVFYPC